jgi:hypothetical protein
MNNGRSNHQKVIRKGRKKYCRDKDVGQRQGPAAALEGFHIIQVYRYTVQICTPYEMGEWGWGMGDEPLGAASSSASR